MAQIRLARAVRFDKALFARVVRLYFRKCGRKGWSPQQPSSSLSSSLSGTSGGGYVILRNANGAFTAFIVTPSGRLRAVEPKDAAAQSAGHESKRPSHLTTQTGRAIRVIDGGVSVGAKKDPEGDHAFTRPIEK